MNSFLEFTEKHVCPFMFFLSYIYYLIVILFSFNQLF